MNKHNKFYIKQIIEIISETIKKNEKQSKSNTPLLDLKPEPSNIHWFQAGARIAVLF